VIGDVCGKGADAAAVTALARYTLRAAAMQQTAPSSILETLNSAMLSQRDDRRFCTVIYAALRVEEGSAELDLAVGGHPLPLLVSASGEVREVGRPGTLIGVVEEPRLADEHVRLEPGEALVFFTDGVTDVNVADLPSAGAWLRELLASCAGCTAAEIAERIETATVEVQGGRPRDDVAILVLRMPPA
jgi:serine phosphatase RsbU (regulator of sigma subunit)